MSVHTAALHIEGLACFTIGMVSAITVHKVVTTDAETATTSAGALVVMDAMLVPIDALT